MNSAKKRVLHEWRVRPRVSAGTGMIQVTVAGAQPKKCADLTTRGDWEKTTAVYISQGHLLSQEEWLAERARSATIMLRSCVEVNPNKRGGIPVLKGTRFTIAQLFAEIAEGPSIAEIAENFDLDRDTIKELLQGFSMHLDRPMFR